MIENFCSIELSVIFNAISEKTVLLSSSPLRSSKTWGGYYRILCVSERFLLLILLGGEILRVAAEITSSQIWDYRLCSQKEQLLGKAECLANCSVCIGLLWGARLAAAVCRLARNLVPKLC